MKINLKELEKLANTLRQEIIEMLLQAKSGHCAGPLGAVEEYIALYFGGILKYDSQNPDWLDRDRVIVSNGHYAPLLYAVLAHAGYFEQSEKQGNPYFIPIFFVATFSGSIKETESSALILRSSAKDKIKA